MSPPLTKLSSNEAAAIQLDKISVNSVTCFSIFILNNGFYDLFAAPGYKWHSSELDRLKKNGHNVLYYHTSECSKVEKYQQVSALSLSPSLSDPMERVVNITDVGAELTKLIYDTSVDDSTIAKGQEIAAAMVACMIDNNACVAALGKLANHHLYTYYHSARVAAYAISIAIEMNLTDRVQLEVLALGCLFHDIGKSKIHLDILNKSEPLTSDEWKMIQKHPEFGGEIVSFTNLGQVPREIILHHHERLDGVGYPHKLRANEIITEVRIAAFADTFDALTTNRPYQASRSRFEALDLIRHRFLDQLDKECYRAMIAIFQKASHL